MNMPINKQVLEDAAAMANIPTPMRDVYAMIEGKLKITRPVEKLLAKLMNGEHVEPERYASYETTRKKELTPRQIRTNSGQTSLEIVALLEDGHKTAAEIALGLGANEKSVRNYLIAAKRNKLIDSNRIRSSKVVWFKVGYTHKVIEDSILSEKNRSLAIQQRKVYFESFPCERCHTATRNAETNRCLKCTQINSRQNYHNKMEKQESSQ